MSFVLDASATLAFIFPDERDEMAIRLVRRLRESRAVAPLIWRWEVQNAIVTVERRGRLTPDVATSLLRDVAGVPVDLDARDGGHVELSRRFALPIYDALYLDLAFRTHLPLATRDQKLIEAAGRLGVAVLT
ncbi:MAG TPA: type II toxin-antitoxin system VapC family toxin [Verrucomicrobiae bacterium]|jgi:predicted nucleic acid-binding protein|nr:type II toxin-antitoxin system VapC family toxin [Verrucomicrobiae bacterium]